jgi:hypothetical protein
MNSSETPSIPERSPLVRLARWCFHPRTLGMLFCALLSLVTIVGIFYLEELWRGKRAWQSYKAQMARQGIKLDFEDYLPPKVPDDQNFTMTPFLAPLFDFLPGTQTLRDTNAVNRIKERNESPYVLGTNLGFSLGLRAGYYEKGQKPDLIALLGTNLTKSVASPGPLPVPVARPTNQEQAALIILDILKQTYDPVLDELRAASHRPYCRFNIKYDYAPLAGVELSHLASLKGIVVKLSWRAEAELALGRSQAALDDLLLGLRLSDTVRGEPFLISHLVRIACHAIMTRTIWTGLATHQWSEAQLQQLQAALAKYDLLEDSEQVLRGERAGFGVRTIMQLMTPEGGAYLSGLMENGDAGRWMHRLMPRGWLYFEAMNVSRGFQLTMAPYENWRAGQLDTRGFLDGLGHENDLFKNRNPLATLFGHRIFVGLLLPATGRVFDKSLQAQGRIDLAHTACALERYRLAHGQYPDSLEALVPAFLPKLPPDLMSRKPLVYRRDTPQSYLLYSVGRNLVDDGGKLVCNKNGVITYDQGDWVWPMPEK